MRILFVSDVMGYLSAHARGVQAGLCSPGPYGKRLVAPCRNVGTGDFCSKCFREKQMAQQAAQKTAEAVSLASRPAQPAVAEAAAQPMLIPEASVLPSASAPSLSSTPSDGPSPPPASNPCRCVGLCCPMRRERGLATAMSSSAPPICRLDRLLASPVACVTFTNKRT